MSQSHPTLVRSGESIPTALIALTWKMCGSASQGRKFSSTVILLTNSTCPTDVHQVLIGRLCLSASSLRTRLSGPGGACERSHDARGNGSEAAILARSARSEGADEGTPGSRWDKTTLVRRRNRHSLWVPDEM